MAAVNRLLRPAADGDPEGLALALREISPDEANGIGQTALHVASIHGHVPIIKLLIEAGANVNAANQFGQTPLHFAVTGKRNQLEVAQLLVDNGANKRAKDARGEMPGDNDKASAEMKELLSGETNKLHEAVSELDLSALRAALDEGVELLDTDSKGRTPFHMAATVAVVIADNQDEGEAPEIKATEQAIVPSAGAYVTLRGIGAQPELNGRNGTVLASDHSTEAADGYKRGRIPVQLDDGGEPLLLKPEALLGQCSLDALLLLLKAAEARGERCVRTACGTLDDDGMGPLHTLVQGGHLAGAALLLRAGADVNAQCRSASDDEYRSGAWGKTAADGSKEVMRAEGDRTALHMAVDSEGASGDMVALLLAHGADPNIQDMSKRTALHAALDFGEDHQGVNLELAELLLQHGADPSLGSSDTGLANSCVHAATMDGHAEALSVLLRHGADHSAAGKGGWTPLALAARGGTIGVVAPLLAAGADPDAPTPMGKSAREVATLNKRAKVLEAFDKFAAPKELS